jgi:hypothetical protein
MSVAESITCREIVELITDYVESAMSEADRARFEDHLRGCRGCVIFLAQMRATIHATGTLTEDAIPPAMRESLLRAFRDWRRT